MFKILLLNRINCQPGWMKRIKGKDYNWGQMMLIMKGREQNKGEKCEKIWRKVGKDNKSCLFNYFATTH